MRLARESFAVLVGFVERKQGKKRTKSALEPSFSFVFPKSVRTSIDSIALIYLIFISFCLDELIYDDTGFLSKSLSLCIWNRTEPEKFPPKKTPWKRLLEILKAVEAVLLCAKKSCISLFSAKTLHNFSSFCTFLQQLQNILALQANEADALTKQKRGKTAWLSAYAGIPQNDTKRKAVKTSEISMA